MNQKSIFKICTIFIVLVFIGMLTFTKLLPWLDFKEYVPKDGDLIFQSLPQNDLVLAIEGISQSPYSHCGIVVQKNGEWEVLEAIGPVKYTPLYEWVQRGRNQSFAVFRLKTDVHIKPFISQAETYLGKPYDVKYELDDEKIYCSELIYKAYETVAKIKLGELKALGEMPWETFTKTIRKYEQGSPPLERLMITPKNLSESLHLKKIFEMNY